VQCLARTGEPDADEVVGTGRARHEVRLAELVEARQLLAHHVGNARPGQGDVDDAPSTAFTLAQTTESWPT
jgi:hypothetical protein